MNTGAAAAQVLDQTSLSIDDQSVAITGQTRHVVAVLVAAGADGLDEQALVAELWSEAPIDLERRTEQLADSLDRVCQGMVERQDGRWRLAFPVGQVDLWRFHELAANARTDWSQPENYAFLLTVDVFPGVERTERISDGESRFHAVREEVAERESERAGSPLPGWLSLVRSRARLRPIDGQGSERTGPLPALIEREDQAFLTTGTDRTARRTVDRIDQVDHAEDGSTVVLITGIAGAGKTRLLARMASLLQRRGWRPIEGVPATTELDDRPTVIIVDDHHLLRVEQAEQLERLSSAETQGPRCFVITSTDDDDRTVAIKRGLMRRAVGTIFVSLEPLEMSDVMEIVVDRFPTISPSLTASLASDLHRASYGLPAEIESLIPMVDRRSYLLNDRRDKPGSSTGDAPESKAAREALLQTALAAADRAERRGRYRDVVRILVSVAETDGIELGLSTRATLANALHRTGAHEEASRIRSGLVGERLADDDPERALDAALIALPEAERVDGDESRLQDLLSIPVDRLDDRRRTERANAIFRQAMLLGDSALAGRWLASIGDGDVADELAARAVADWYATAADDQPAHRLLRSEGLVDHDDLSPEWRGRIHQVRSIDLYQLGLIDEAIAANRSFQACAEATEDHLRLWHTMAFDAMLAFDFGRWSEAESLRDAALGHAHRHSIIEGEVLYIAQSFHQAWLCGIHGEFAELAGRLSPDVSGTRLGRAAIASACLNAGDPVSARQLGLPVIEEAMAQESFESHSIAALLAPLIRAHGTEPIEARVHSLLEPRAGTAIVNGAGISSFGPTDRYLFQLTGDVAHLDGAIAWADRCGVPLWRVLLRLDYVRAGLPGSDLLDRQARSIAAGTDLERLFDAES